MSSPEIKKGAEDEVLMAGAEKHVMRAKQQVGEKPSETYPEHSPEAAELRKAIDIIESLESSSNLERSAGRGSAGIGAGKLSIAKKYLEEVLEEGVLGKPKKEEGGSEGDAEVKEK